jgi:ribonucleoside-triphosphate reductase
MSKYIRKKNGTEQEFNVLKIRNAISKAGLIDLQKLDKVMETLTKWCDGRTTLTTEEVHDLVEKALMKHNCYDVAKSYIIYRDTHKKNHQFSDEEEKIISICKATNEDVSGDNANKRPTFVGTMRDYVAGTMAKAIARKVLPKDIIEAHDKGLIHFHDMDYSPLQPMHNCCLVNTFDMLQNGFQMGDVKIEKPHSFSTACNLVSQVALHVSSSQYGLKI